MFKPRPKQAEVLKYTSGKMGVSAVPGSGKTRTLSYLAASLITANKVDDRQEVLIVTLVNAAAEHFARQVGQFVQEHGLLPNLGYRVRTLHALANDIVRERPGLVGLDKDYKIIDEREADAILEDAVNSWLRVNDHIADDFIDPNMDENRAAYIKREQWPREAKNIASAFIKQAKDWQLEPSDIRRTLDKSKADLPLVTMCLQIYVDYQRSLSYRGAVDFQDLIRLALKAINADKDYLDRLRQRWPYILEDEAQDSSKLQEEILATLAGGRGNWVRVGDPNQAIYETFTTARPEYLRAFLEKRNVKSRELPNSGRCQPSIMALANHLIDWSMHKHPVPAVRERAPLQPPYIEPTPEGDPQPNPPDDPAKVVLFPEDFTPEQETRQVVRSVKRWLPENPDSTVAILVPRNDRGAQVVKALKANDIEVVELLRSSSTTRETAGALWFVLHALSDPNGASALGDAFRVWRREDRDDEAASPRLEAVVKAIKSCKQVEDYLYPRPDGDWLEGERVSRLMADFEDAAGIIYQHLLTFRDLMQRWQAAVLLPIDQLVLTIGADLFDTAADLAVAHSLAVYLRQTGQTATHWRLPQYATELRLVAQNKRRVMDIAADADQHDPEKHKGKVTVATMHAAKGMEWDRVYLTSVNNYDFPSGEPQDRFIGEPWWGRDRLNIQAEALEQLACINENRIYVEGHATQSARTDYAAERLRLLYVGITRARRELVLTWNTGRDGKVFQATPFIGLQNWWDSHRVGET